MPAVPVPAVPVPAPSSAALPSSTPTGAVPPGAPATTAVPAAPSTEPSPSVPPAAVPAPDGREQPDAAGVRALADLLADADPAAGWDLWTAAAQRAVGRATYADALRACTEPVAAVVVGEVVPGAAAALTIGGAPREAVYEDGRWRLQPAATVLDQLSDGVVDDLDALCRARP